MASKKKSRSPEEIHPGSENLRTVPDEARARGIANHANNSHRRRIAKPGPESVAQAQDGRDMAGTYGDSLMTEPANQNPITGPQPMGQISVSSEVRAYVQLSALKLSPYSVWLLGSIAMGSIKAPAAMLSVRRMAALDVLKLAGLAEAAPSADDLSPSEMTADQLQKAINRGERVLSAAKLEAGRASEESVKPEDPPEGKQPDSKSGSTPALPAPEPSEPAEGSMLETVLAAQRGGA